MKSTILVAIAAVCLTSCARPIAKFTYDTPKKTAPTAINFENQSEKAESYEWDFGDGKTSTEVTPTHRYTQSGNYEIKMKAIKGKKSTTSTERIVINAPEICLVEIQTEFGNMLVQLYDKTPKHRDNFVKLAEEGFYNDLLFHRVIDGFMIQGGDPDSKNAKEGQPLGGGGPGYQVDGEFNDDFVHVKGALAAARTSDNVNPERRSSGSQFYIVHGRPVDENMIKVMERRLSRRYDAEQRATYLKDGGAPHLDNSYTVFGRVIDGLDVIDKIATVKKDGRDRPVEDLKMQVVVIK